MNNKAVIKETKSICPICLEKIDAQLVKKKSEVFLEKECPEHGKFSTIVWRNLPSYEQWGTGYEGGGPEITQNNIEHGCPYDCGLCSEHKAQTCTVLVELTSKCNMKCPVCFAMADNKNKTVDPDIEEIREMFNKIIECGGPFPLQLSGGEPTVRDDLFEIIFMAKQMGFRHVQLNTNGIKIAEDPVYALELKQAGLDLVYLQFDGVTDDVYQTLRGRDLFSMKQTVIKNCSKAKLAVQLVPVLIPNVNTHQIGEIVKFAKEGIPTIKGIHFQPVSYFGRFPESPSNEARFTLPEVLQAMEIQTEGEIQVSDFLPRKKKDSHCGFSGFYILDEDNNLQATTSFDSSASQEFDCCDSEDMINPAKHVRQFIEERSKYVEEAPCPCCSTTPQIQEIGISKYINRSKTHYLSISGMPFQDAWTLDLERLEGCCIHVFNREKKQLVPFCANYLTSINGERLYK